MMTPAMMNPLRPAIMECTKIKRIYSFSGILVLNEL